MKEMLAYIFLTSEKIDLVYHQAILKYVGGKVIMRAMRATAMLMAFTLVGVFMVSCADRRDKLPDILYGDEYRVWYVDFDNDERWHLCFYFNKDGTWKILDQDPQDSLHEHVERCLFWTERWRLENDTTLVLGETAWKVRVVSPTELKLCLDTTTRTLQPIAYNPVHKQGKYGEFIGKTVGFFLFYHRFYSNLMVVAGKPGRPRAIRVDYPSDSLTIELAPAEFKHIKLFDEFQDWDTTLAKKENIAQIRVFKNDSLIDEIPWSKRSKHREIKY